MFIRPIRLIRVPFLRINNIKHKYEHRKLKTMQQILKPAIPMRKILFPMMALLFVASCSKDKGDADKGIDPGDAATVAASITVMNSEKKDGNMPPAANNTGSIVLFDPQKIITLAGKYAVIEPSVQTGTPTGFNVQVKGASGYFKITTTTSSKYIAIQLPENIKPGSFKVVFNAFDASNNVSNTVEAVIEVIEKLGGAGSEILTGTWKLTGELKSNGVWDYNVYDLKPEARYYINCINGKLGSLHVSTDPYPTVWASIWKFQLKKNEMVFQQNGTMQQDYQKDAYMIDYGLSTCSDIVYSRNLPTDNYWNQSSGFIYNAATKRLSFISNYETSLKPTYLNEYEILELSGSKMIIRYVGLTGAMEFSKQ